MTGPSDVIREQVELALPARYRPLTRWAGPRQRDWSWHFAGVGGDIRLLVKVPRWEGVRTLDGALAVGSQADTAAEFAALGAIADMVASGGDTGLVAAQPVVYVAPVNAIVLEWLDAVPLGSRLRRPGSGAAAAAIVTRAGRWLRLFHERGGLDDHPFDSPGAGWRELAGSPRRRPRTLEEARESVAGMAGRFAGRVVPTGTIHGDFSLSNVLVTVDGKVAVVDPNRSRGAALSDPARLAAEILLGRTRLASMGLVPGTSRARRWIDHLMSGYGSHDAEVFAYELAAACLARWVDLEERSTGVGRAVLAMDRRLFRSEIARLAA